MELDDHLRVSPGLAERLDQPDPTTYVVTLRRGVKFHDGHELTSADVVYTFRSFLDPAFVSAKKGGYREAAVDRRARPLHRGLHAEQAVRVVSDQSQTCRSCRTAPARRFATTRSGRDRTVSFSYAVDDRLELAAFDDYFAGRPKNDGLIFKIMPDDIMRGLELQEGHGRSSSSTSWRRTSSISSRRSAICRPWRRPGVDYQYVGPESARSDPSRRSRPAGAGLCHRPPGHRRVSAPRPRDTG